MDLGSPDRKARNNRGERLDSLQGLGSNQQPSRYRRDALPVSFDACEPDGLGLFLRSRTLESNQASLWTLSRVLRERSECCCRTLLANLEGWCSTTEHVRLMLSAWVGTPFPPEGGGPRSVALENVETTELKGWFGARSWDRTSDLRFDRPMLNLLSYLCL